MFWWEVTIVVGVMCSRWHKSLSHRHCLWDKLMCTGSNIGKEWLVWFGICGWHIFHLSKFTFSIDRGVRWWHYESTACQRLGQRAKHAQCDKDRCECGTHGGPDFSQCDGWSNASEVAHSTVMREWKLLIVNGCKFKCLMPEATGLQMPWQDGTNASMCLGITLKNNDTLVNWMSYI